MIVKSTFVHDCINTTYVSSDCNYCVSIEDIKIFCYG